MTLLPQYKLTRLRFFDKQVADSLEPGKRRVLSKFGAYVRTSARSSLRTRKKSSLPGQPPSMHVGTIKQLLFFALDKERESVVIGPTRTNSPTRSGQPVPKLMEHGGIVRGEGRLIRYLPRPFMKPAFDKNLIALRDILKRF